MSEKNIESKVPGEHNIREVNDGELKEKETLTSGDKAQTSTSQIAEQNQSFSEGNTSEIATADDFTLSPVITVTKKEATFTKGDMKLQKVTVTEDISHTSTNNYGEGNFNRRLTYEIHTSVTQPKAGQNDHKNDGTGLTKEEITESKRLKTKIPMSRLRQAVNRVRNDLKEKKRLEKEKEIPSTSRKSSIPRLKESKIPPPKDIQIIKKEEETEALKADEEFDKMFKDLIPSEDTSLEFINTDIDNINQIETSFEEIIHAYEDNKILQTNKDKIKQSRIPLLKRKSEHEIDIPKIKEKQVLKKSNSVDTKIQTTFTRDVKEKMVSEQTKTYTQSNVRTQLFTVQKDHELNHTVVENQFDNSIQIQESNTSEIKEKIKIAIPVFNIQTKETIDKTSIENEDITQDITITKNLNFDKETVSKIYKIDFTENNFDSLDMTLVNESLKRDQKVDLQKENEDNNITKEVSKTNEFKSNTKQTESSSKTTKIFERTNYNEDIVVDNKIESHIEVKANQTTEINKGTFIQSVKTNENSDKKQSSFRQVALDTNKVTNTKANKSSATSSNFMNEDIASNTQAIRQLSREGNLITTNISNEKGEKTISSVKELDLDSKKIGPDQSIITAVPLESDIIETKATSIGSEIQSMKQERSQSIAYDDIQTGRQLSLERKWTITSTNNENIEKTTDNPVKEQEPIDNASNIKLFLNRDALKTKTSAVFSKQTVKTSEDKKDIAFDNKNIRQTLEGYESTEIKTSQITAESLEESVKINERETVKKELQDTKTIEFGSHENIIRNVSVEGNKKIGPETSIFIKTSETSDKGKKELVSENENIKTCVIAMTDNLLSDVSTQETTEINQKDLKVKGARESNIFETSSSKNLSNKTLDTKLNRLSIESSIDLLKRIESNNEKRNRTFNKTSSEDYSFKTLETFTENLNVEDLTDFLKNKRNKKTKLEELSRRYENIDTDTMKISVEANKTVDNKTTKNTNNEAAMKTTDTSKNKQTIEDQLLNQKSNIESKSISTSINENKVKETFTINNSKSELNKQTTTNKITASNTSLNKLDPSKRDITKTLTNTTQNTEDINKIYSEVFTKMNAQKQSFETTKINEDKQMNANFNKSENNIQNIETALEEDIPIIKGKVNRVIQRISSIDNKKSVEKNRNDLPKKISILSKIQMFERGEQDEVYSKTRIPKLDSKTSRTPNPVRQTSSELRRPKIVREILKETKEITETSKQTESLHQDSKVFTKTTKLGILEDTVSRETKLKDDEVLNSTQTDTKLLITDYKQVKDVVKEINKANEDNSIKTESNLVEKTTKESDISTSIQNTFDTKTELNIEGNIYNKQISNEINKVETNTYTKIYTNNTEKTLTSSKYERIQDKTIENVFDFTPKDNILNNKSIINKEKTNKYLNNDNNIDNKAKSLEYIRQTTRKSYERLESEKERSFDMRRTTSVAELEIGGVVKGRVFDMIMRINSMEILSQGKKEIQREQPRKSSVSEKIALFEGRLPPIKTDKKKEIYRMKNETEVSLENTEEYYSKKIEELSNVKNNYETIIPEFLELRDTSEMPVIALGTALLDKRLIKNVVEAAIDLGYRAIDTAYIYGNEKEIGEAINNKINDGTVKREDLYIISKLWSTYHRKDLVEKACRQSLDTMGLKYFDLYLIHNPMSLLEGSDPLPKIANVLQYSEYDYMDAWRGIEDLIVKGLVRRGGVSNFNSEQIHRIMEKGRIKPVVNQVECHPYLSQERLGGFCDAFGMRLSCYGVLGSKGTPVEHKSDLPPVIDDPLVLVMAAGLGVTPGQMLIAYQLHNSRSVVIKATSAAHLYDNLKAQFISLEPTHLTALKSLNKNKRTYYLKGLGETHKNYPFNIAF